jgi:hypothetical protein
MMALQPLLTGRWFAVRRMQAIRAIERARGTRVITMIHRQEIWAQARLSGCRSRAGQRS